jgi:hypothetical protein
MPVFGRYGFGALLLSAFALIFTRNEVLASIGVCGLAVGLLLAAFIAVSSQLLNLVLLFHPLGRYALTPPERLLSRLTAAEIGLIAANWSVDRLFRSDDAQLGAWACTLSLIWLVSVASSRLRRPNAIRLVWALASFGLLFGGGCLVLGVANLLAHRA